MGAVHRTAGVLYFEQGDWGNRHGNAFVRANTLPIARIFVRDPVLDGSEAVPRRFTYFGAREATIFSKRGSPRSGSQNGSSFKLP